jgi:hypothetical protein
MPFNAEPSKNADFRLKLAIATVERFELAQRLGLITEQEYSNLVQEYRKASSEV